MAKVSFRAPNIPTHCINAPSQEIRKVLLLGLLPDLLMTFEESLQLREELLDWIQVWRVRWQVDQYDACVAAHSFQCF